MFRLGEYLAVKGAVAAFQAIPYDASLAVARWAARLLYRVDARHRRRTLEHLGRAYDGARAAELSPRVFQNIGRHAAEFLSLIRRSPPRIRVEQVDVLRRAHALGRGVVVVSAHLGAFTLLGPLSKRLGIPAAVILKRQKNPRLLAWIGRSIRSRFGVEVVLKPDARDRVAGLLARGRAVVFFADQHPIGGGVPATFFSRPVEAAAGPAVFARRGRAPLIVATTSMEPDGSHAVRFDGPIPAEGPIAATSQGWLDVLEARIRQHPDQWMWMHRRWRPPPGHSGL